MATPHFASTLIESIVNETNVFMKTRRHFLKQSTWMLGALTSKPVLGSASSSSFPQSSDRFDLTNDLRFEIQTKNGYFQGIGEVKAGNIVLRSGRRPMFVEITGPDGIRLMNYQLKDTVKTADNVYLWKL
jgi:hypothetical protein